MSWDWFGRSSSPQNRLLTQHFAQHAEKFPKDFSAAGLVFRVVTTVENTPQRGWGTLIVEFGYRPRHGAKKKAP